ncbi:MAG: CopD family protein [Brevundimonas sp.]|uniref:CopD family protein n=1 Tax=Brevundimonas sp. TaxID=1871086 RepID=UPI0011FFA945|nr:CopD family protein [Brevundimonas sp.]RZJ18229.1 MAG: CopD family protein [Brevundimonas sp.]
MTAYDLARGLHILAVIAWMSGMLYLPRLYAYDAEQAAKPEPLRSEMQALLRTWQARLLRIIINPAMILAFVFGGWLIWIDGTARGWDVFQQPWMVTKLAGVFLLAAWHSFLAGQRKKIAAGTSTRSARFWRMSNEVPFVLAIVMVLSVTLEWTF